MPSEKSAQVEVDVRLYPWAKPLAWLSIRLGLPLPWWMFGRAEIR